MKYELDLKQTAVCCHATVTGDNSVQTVSAYLDELARLCAQHRCARLLIEERLRGPSFSVTDVYSVVVEAARKVPPTLRKIAFVDVNPEHRVENMVFAETVAVNRGVNIRRFATIEEALRWLRGEASEELANPAT